MREIRSVATRVHRHSLSLVFGVIFVAALIGQSVAGQHQLNAELHAEGFQRVS